MGILLELKIMLLLGVRIIYVYLQEQINSAVCSRSLIVKILYKVKSAIKRQGILIAKMKEYNFERC